jgi:hypothetical protein
MNNAPFGQKKKAFENYRLKVSCVFGLYFLNCSVFKVRTWEVFCIFSSLKVASPLTADEDELVVVSVILLVIISFIAGIELDDPTV